MAAPEARLVRAKAYLVIAESKDSKREAYKRAAKEIAAYKQEARATYADIAISLGRSKDYPKRLVDWHNSGFKDETPFVLGGDMARTAAVAHAKRVLREQPLEVVERIIDELPQARKVKIAAAAHDSYFEESEKKSEERARKTPKERRETRDFVDEVAKPIKTMLGSMRANAIVESLREAKEELSALVADGELSLEAVQAIDHEIEEFQRELEFARQLVGGGD